MTDDLRGALLAWIQEQERITPKMTPGPWEWDSRQLVPRLLSALRGEVERHEVCGHAPMVTGPVAGPEDYDVIYACDECAEAFEDEEDSRAGCEFLRRLAESLGVKE